MVGEAPRQCIQHRKAHRFAKARVKQGPGPLVQHVYWLFTFYLEYKCGGSLDTGPGDKGHCSRP